MKKIIFTSLLVLGAFVYFHSSNKRSGANTPQQPKAEGSSMHLNESAGVQSAPAQTVEGQLDNQTVGAHQKYFSNNLMKSNIVSALYRSVSEKLPTGRPAQLVSEFIAETVMRSDDPEFARYMHDLKEDLDRNHDQIFQVLQDNESTLKADSFQYNMALNLVSFGSFSDEQKLRILGGGIISNFEFDEDGGMAFSATNITNALILMRKNNLSADQVQSYVRQGLQINQGHELALAQYKLRVSTYYPGLNLD